MPIFQPTDISGLFSWYKSHSLDVSMSGVITYWQDSSGSGNHVSFVFPSSNNTCPVYVPEQINGYPVVRFDGSNDYLAGTGDYFSNLPVSSLTSFVVYKSNSNSKQVIFANDNDDVGSPTLGAKNNFILGINSTNNVSGLYFGWGKDKGVTIYTEDSSGIQIPNSQWYVRSDRWRITDNEFIFGLNGTDFSGSYATSMSQSINNRLKIGATVSLGYPENFFYGDIAEIAAYSRRLNELEVSEITNYLLYKYNISNSHSMTLFTWATDNGSESGIYKPISLYAYNIDSLHSGCNLYVNGVEPIISETGICLYTHSSLIQNTGLVLYIPGSYQYNNISMYLYGVDSYYTGLPLYTASALVSESGFDIYITGYPATYTSTINGYIGSSQTCETGVSLYMNPSTSIQNSFDLYTSATDSLYTFTTMMIPGQYEYSSIPLKIHGHITHETGVALYTGASLNMSNGQDLYIVGKITYTASMNLVVKQLPPPSSRSSIPLYMDASTSGFSGLYSNMPMYMYAYGKGDSMPLFVKNSSTNYPLSSSTMLLFVKAQNLYSGYDGGISLTAFNNTAITGRMGKLYIRGDGVMDGALIYSDHMNLFLKGNTVVENGADLYIVNNSVFNSCISLYHYGVYNYNSGLSMSIKGLSVYNSGTVIYVGGKESTNSGLELNIIGNNYYLLDAKLYTHGY